MSKEYICSACQLKPIKHPFSACIAYKCTCICVFQIRKNPKFYKFFNEMPSWFTRIPLTIQRMNQKKSGGKYGVLGNVGRLR